MFDKLLHHFGHRPYRLHVAVDRRVPTEHATIIFWHGVAANSQTWDKVIGAMAQNPAFSKTRLVAIDLLGFGRSPAPTWSDYAVDDNLRALRFTLKKLHVRAPLILVGHSMGGLLAVEYAARYPRGIAALALASPPFLKPTESGALFDRLYRKIYVRLKNAADTKRLEKVAQTFEKFTSFDSKSLKNQSFRRAMQNVVIGGQAWSAVSRLNLPIEIFHGTFDSLVNGTNLATLAKLPNVTLHKSGVGHDVVGKKAAQLMESLARLVAATR
jgi:pimeloyl-ACP methyl ester carboxylesterase